MRLLKESYGESDELNNFVYLSRYRFNEYYQVTLDMKDAHKTQERYFAFEDAAREYYDGLVDEIKEDPEYYGWTDVTMSKITINGEPEELDNYETFGDDE